MNYNRKMDKKPVEVQVGELLWQHSLKLGLAESCTGGLVSHWITNVPGSSSYFVGGIIAYAYEAKVQLLNVSWQTLNDYGAVSRETVLEMAQGVRRALNVDIGLSISGIAGPDGGTPEKPVGTTWIGLAAADYAEAWVYQWPGDRLEVKTQSARQALEHVAAYLKARQPAAAERMGPTRD